MSGVTLVALFALLQRSAPAALQGRVYSAVEGLLLGVEAAVVAGAGVWLLTRPAQGVTASH